jgi:hypothetical protein
MTIFTRKEVIESMMKSINDMLETIPPERRAKVLVAMCNSLAGMPIVYDTEEEKKT